MLKVDCPIGRTADKTCPTSGGANVPHHVRLHHCRFQSVYIRPAPTLRDSLLAMDITGFILSHRDNAFLLGDHGHYRGLLSRQLATLRKRVGRSTPKNAKYSPKPITAEDIGGNPE
jgi:hypothetical protein